MESKKTPENINIVKETIFVRLSRSRYISLIPKNRKMAAAKRWLMELNGSENPEIGIMGSMDMISYIYGLCRLFSRGIS